MGTCTVLRMPFSVYMYIHTKVLNPSIPPCENMHIWSLSCLNETWLHVISLNITIKAHINAKTESCILADELHRGSLQKQRSPELGRDSSIQTMLIISFRFNRVEQVLTYVISPSSRKKPEKHFYLHVKGFFFKINIFDNCCFLI